MDLIHTWLLIKTLIAITFAVLYWRECRKNDHLDAMAREYFSKLSISKIESESKDRVIEQLRDERSLHMESIEALTNQIKEEAAKARDFGMFKRVSEESVKEQEDTIMKFDIEWLKFKDVPEFVDLMNTIKTTADTMKMNTHDLECFFEETAALLKNGADFYTDSGDNNKIKFRR